MTYQLAFGVTPVAAPTLGSNVEQARYSLSLPVEDLEQKTREDELSFIAFLLSGALQVQHAGTELEVWDVGGQESMRPTWPSFVPNARVLVLVVDSTDRACLPLTKAELWNLLERSELGNAILLVLANKQDIEHAMSQEEVEEGLAIDRVKHDCCVQLCSALKNEGLSDAFTWVSNRLKEQSAK